MTLEFAIVALLLGVALTAYTRIVRTRNGKAPSWSKETPHHGNRVQIVPVNDYDWKSTEQQKFRPFKPIYHITMAVRSSSPSDLIIIDNNYLDRLNLRQDIIKNHTNHVLGCNPAGINAVRETYSYLIEEYLPARYPSLFSKDEKEFHNHVTHSSAPLTPPEDPLESLRILGRNVDDDMFLLENTPDGHRNTAFLCCFPSGFDPAAKFGKLLKDIHTPVPSYEKIGPSMERFFGRLEVGKSVNRVNWSISTSTELFNLATNHVNEGDVVEQDVDVDISKARVRCELQTVTRLPKTNAILFSFKTYMYSVEDIKAEGLGPGLADAIEGLGSGNAPGMFKYKGGVRWGKSVCEYLRS